jgi:hypothetical protein
MQLPWYVAVYCCYVSMPCLVPATTRTYAARGTCRFQARIDSADASALARPVLTYEVP